ncbi:YqaA family protein [Methanolobus chelungpuianus]|uniref:Membrane protein n=1 Tax=Methanolobus chelungpuianus TaxID=502115 RepID=A0AAE3H822_9EURY|nr:YqaA family protein [Methanolobus chelungpuianus]MCQ6961826.1 membrane protein [Methanolobus chelungpuianus]
MFEQLMIPVSAYAYMSLFITSFLASTVLPIGSEALVILLIRSGYDLPVVVLVATTGNYLGACTTYYIGLKGRTGVIEKYLSISRKDLEKADRWFTRYGSYALLFTWVPLIGDAITASGGLLKLNFRIFSIYVFIGKFARYLVLAYIAAGI